MGIKRTYAKEQSSSKCQRAELSIKTVVLCAFMEICTNEEKWKIKGSGYLNGDIQFIEAIQDSFFFGLNFI